MKPRIAIEDARRLFLGAEGLLDDPERPTTAGTVEKLVRSLGFVQIDSINYVERAHHLTLGARLDEYRPEMLHDLIENRRSLFEHWTHDASAIPCEWFPHWRPRFGRFLEQAQQRPWWRSRMGKEPLKTMAHVRERIEKEGPLRSRDFDHDWTLSPRPEKGWWGWKPQKMALECLWRMGELAIAGRENFQKVYDLTHRVLPKVHALPKPGHKEHVEWACSSALDRLGVATSSELAAFWGAIKAAEARAWCDRAERDGRIARVEMEPGKETTSGTRHQTFAPQDWKDRLSKLPAPPSRIRFMSPFDPVVRDRKRLSRLFGFDYNFEAFVPEGKRQYGYYVMPILEGERFVGRIDPKFDRSTGTLLIRNVWWEPGIRPTRKRRHSLEEGAERLAALIGAGQVEIKDQE